MSIIRSNIVVSNLEQLFCKSFKALQLLLTGLAEKVSPAVRQGRLRHNEREIKHSWKVCMWVLWMFRSLKLSVPHF